MRNVLNLLCSGMAFIFTTMNCYYIFEIKDYPHATWCVTMAVFFLVCREQNI